MQKSPGENTKPFWTRRRAITGIVLLAFLLRLWASFQLPVDYDEPIYLEAAYHYADSLRSGDVSRIVDYPVNREHPALVKMLYGAAALVVGEDASWYTVLLAARLVSVFFGTMAVLLVSLVSPTAGFMLAVQTLAVKYTSQAYLEAVPLFTSVAAVLALHYFQSRRESQPEQPPSKRTGRPEDGFFPTGPWFWLSAAALGLTAASKYTYFPVVFVILFLAFRKRGFNLLALLPYFAVAGLVFLLFNPTLWSDPSNRLWDSLFFHTRYAQSAHVQTSGYAWYQPLLWISQSFGYEWHPGVFFYWGIDGFIFLLGVGGITREWRSRLWVLVWFTAGLLFLLVWPTKWPQYTLVIIPALCLMAAHTYQWLYVKAQEFEEQYGALSDLLPSPGRGFWVMLFGFLGLLLVAYIANTIYVTRNNRGWSQVNTANSFLPSSTVNEIIQGPGDQMILGTDQGLAFWSPPQATDLPDQWVVYNTGNSGLPHNRVLALARNAAGNLWIGTPAGATRFDGQDWQTYGADELGLEGQQVQALAIDRRGGVWASTLNGIAVFDGTRWSSYTASNSGLADDRVFSLLVQSTSTGDMVWAGSLTSISRLDASSGVWTSYSTPEFDMGWGGVADIIEASDGSIWAATLGGGLNHWDGSSWSYFRASNSGLPYNTVQEVLEVYPGVLWFGAAIPNALGGVLASFDGSTWRTYNTNTSGYSGGEPLALAVDQDGRLWIGTRTDGINLYQLHQ